MAAAKGGWGGLEKAGEVGSAAAGLVRAGSEGADQRGAGSLPEGAAVWVAGRPPAWSWVGLETAKAVGSAAVGLVRAGLEGADQGGAGSLPERAAAWLAGRLPAWSWVGLETASAVGSAAVGLTMMAMATAETGPVAAAMVVVAVGQLLESAAKAVQAEWVAVDLAVEGLVGGGPALHQEV